MSLNLGYRLRKSVLLTYSKIRDGVLLWRGESVSRRDGGKEPMETHLRVPNNVEEGNNVGTTGEVLEDLDLALDLLLLDGLEDLDDAFLVVDDVDALKDL